MRQPDGTIRKLRRSVNEPGHAHELTFSCYHNLPLLSNDPTRLWLLDALRQARAKLDLELWAYVIMPEHIHILLLPCADMYPQSSRPSSNQYRDGRYSACGRGPEPSFVRYVMCAEMDTLLTTSGSPAGDTIGTSLHRTWLGRLSTTSTTTPCAAAWWKWPSIGRGRAPAGTLTATTFSCQWTGPHP